MKEIIALRCFQPVYILLDSLFLILLLVLLLYRKKYMTVLVGLAAGVLYMIIDYGVFHLLCHSRSITDGYSLFWVLLWMSMSYGFTNFTWIWLALSKDKHLLEWTVLILCWWFVCPMLAASWGSASVPITIQRTTTEYHVGMALILFVGYLLAIIWNLKHEDKQQRFPMVRLLLIGIGVQLAWETALLLGGIRSAEFSDWGQKLKILVTNSLLETNLGMPYVYALYILFICRRNEQLQKRKEKLSFLKGIEEDNQS